VPPVSRSHAARATLSRATRGPEEDTTQPLAASSDARTEVDTALVLAVDASGSVTDERLRLQYDGYARALRGPGLVAAIQAGRRGRIAATLTEWSGAARQHQRVGWTLIEDAATAAVFAGALLEGPPHDIPDWTSISGAIDYARRLFERSLYDAARRVIDVSGDGANNDGRPAAEARDEAVAAGITINGLPILGAEPDLDVYYRTNVIGGSGAFLIVARDLGSFAEALQRKLLAEITGRLPPGLA
jgi:hypothetical protein